MCLGCFHNFPRHANWQHLVLFLPMVLDSCFKILRETTTWRYMSLFFVASLFTKSCKYRAAEFSWFDSTNCSTSIFYTISKMKIESNLHKSTVHLALQKKRSGGNTRLLLSFTHPISGQLRVNYHKNKQRSSGPWINLQQQNTSICGLKCHHQFYEIWPITLHSLVVLK